MPTFSKIIDKMLGVRNNKENRKFMAKTPSVLLVQHSESASPRIITVLRAAGLAVDAEQVESETHVRAAIERRSWDLVIVEECRPTVDALSVLLLVRKASPQTPFVVVAPSIGADGVAELTREGATDCLTGDWSWPPRPCRSARHRGGCVARGAGTDRAGRRSDPAGSEGAHQLRRSRSQQPPAGGPGLHPACPGRPAARGRSAAPS